MDIRTAVVIENIATLIATAVIVVGLYWLGAGGWSFLGFLLLLNINYLTRRKTDAQP